MINVIVLILAGFHRYLRDTNFDRWAGEPLCWFLVLSGSVRRGDHV
jgi:hypothetical protein